MLTVNPKVRNSVPIRSNGIVIIDGSEVKIIASIAMSVYVMPIRSSFFHERIKMVANMIVGMLWLNSF